MIDRARRYLRRALLIVAPLVCLLILGAVLVYILSPAADIWLIWKVYARYVDTLSNLTGLNAYLVSALALVAFVPFYYAATLVLYHPFNRALRWRGITILLVLAVGYNVSLYVVTRDLTFGFKTDKALKYYAITPDGVKFYDRPGNDTTYGIPLQAVTPDNVTELLTLSRGEFRQVNPRDAVTFFNPRTGAATLWYHEDDEGALEFYNQPGFHPGSGVRLLPVTAAIHKKWLANETARRKAERDFEAKRQAEAAKAREEQERILRERGARVEAECRKLAAGRGSSRQPDYAPGMAWAASMTVYNTFVFATDSMSNYYRTRESVVIDGVRVPCP